MNLVGQVVATAAAESRIDQFPGPYAYLFLRSRCCALFVVDDKGKDFGACLDQGGARVGAGMPY